MDPDNDDFNNAAEFAIDSDPLGTQYNATLDEVINPVIATSDLDKYNLAVTEHSEVLITGLPTLNPGWSYVTFRLTDSLNLHKTAFFRLRLDSNY